MSSNNDDRDKPEKEKKCTRGDKCILIHIIITGVLIVILIIIYVVHLILVKHSGLDAFRISRRALESANIDRTQAEDSRHIGVVYITNERVICNSIFLRQRWSLAPAHCVTIRTEPEHSHLLPNWRIRYQDSENTETDIKKGLVHSYFNKDDFDHNIGLFQHLDTIQLEDFDFPERVSFDSLEENEEFIIVGWNTVDKKFSSSVQFLKPEKCSQFVSPIVDSPRKSEGCVMPDQSDDNVAAVHGAAFVLDSKIVGFFSWGDRTGAVPQVGLAIAPYKSWIENMIAITV